MSEDKSGDPWMAQGGPAFPCEAGTKQYKGMSLRAYIATSAVQGLLAAPVPCTPQERAKAAVAVADALIAELEK